MAPGPARNSTLRKSALLLLIACSGDGPSANTQEPPAGQPPQTNTPAQLQRVSADNQTATVGAALSDSMAVRVLDNRSNAVAGIAVQWHIVSGGGSVTPATSTTAADGVAKTRWTLGTTAGANMLSASAGSLQAITFSATGRAAPAASVAKVAGDAQTSIPATATTDSLTVRVTDAFGNSVSGATVNWVVASGGGSVSPSTSVTTETGHAKTRWTLGSVAGAQTLTAAVTGIAPATFSATAVELRPIDTHGHFTPTMGNWTGAIQATVVKMNELRMGKTIALSTPQPPNFSNSYEITAFLAQLQADPDHFAYVGGGGSLNPIIHGASTPGSVTATLRAQFDSIAADLLARGARGFGEMAALHLSAADWHPYEDIPADHELFLRLADLAAQRDVPIDLHHDIVMQDRPKPPNLTSPLNPPTLRANAAAFERLLQHNRNTKIVWVHAGADPTGSRTVSLMRDMLTRHPNLYMSLVMGRASPQNPNAALDAAGNLRADWRALLTDFSDRFVLGSDNFHAQPGTDPRFAATIDATVGLLSQLPPALALKIGQENARRLYKL